MASTDVLNAIMERLIEQTKKKHPGQDIFKKPPKPKKEPKRKKKDVN